LHFLVGLGFFVKVEQAIDAVSFGLVDQSEQKDPPGS
jgi:hypothetical protein